MKLSELRTAFPIEIVSDGEFDSLGLLSHELSKMLVGFYDARFLKTLERNPHVACVLTSRDLMGKLPSSLAVAVTSDPRSAFYAVHEHLYRNTDFYWKSFPSEIAPNARIHERAWVAGMNVRIGRNTLIEPNVVIMEQSLIGDDCVIRAGSVIGGEGFEPKLVYGRHIIAPHAGGVRIANGAEIQGNVHVARAVYGGFTEIGEETKIGAMSQISHNARLGRRCEVAPAAVITGSVTIGDNVWIGPSACIASEVKIGDGAFVAIGSVVVRDIPAGRRVFGVPAKRLPGSE